MDLNEFMSNHPESFGGFHSLLSAISTLFGLQIQVYCSQDYYTFTPDNDADINASIHIHYNGYSFDSIISSSLTSVSLYNDPPVTGFNQKLMLKVSTWNLNGCSTNEMQLMIDYELKTHRISIACVQETHLRCRAFNSPNYKWILGPQVHGRASRGLNRICFIN